MRSVFFAAKVFFGRASAAAPAPATWISLRLEMVIDVRSISLGKRATRTRRAGGPKHTRNHESSRGTGDEAGTPSRMVSPPPGYAPLRIPRISVGWILAGRHPVPPPEGGGIIGSPAPSPSARAP